MKKFNTVLSWIYALTLGYIPIAVWSVWLGILSAIRIFPNYMNKEDSGFFIVIIIIAYFGLFFLIQFFVKTKWGIKYDDDISSIRPNRDSLLTQSILDKIESWKKVKVSFGSSKNLKNLWNSILSNDMLPSSIQIEAKHLKIDLTNLDSEFPRNVSNIPVKEFNTSYNSSATYTIKFEDKPPLQLIKILSRFRLKFFRSFSLKYKLAVLSALETIKEKYSNFKEGEYENISNLLNQKNLHGEYNISYEEYALKFGSFVEKISYKDWEDLKSIYEKACRKREELKLNEHISTFVK